MLPDGKKSSDVLILKKKKRQMKEKACQTPFFMIEQMVATDFRVNKNGKVTTVKSLLKKRAKSTDDVSATSIKSEKVPEMKAAIKKLKKTPS